MGSVSSVNELDIAWAAGFFDGEGNVRVVKQTRDGRENRWVHMQIGQSDRRPLDRFRAIFGGKIVPLGPSKLSKSQRWHWYLYRRAEVDAAMEAMRPHLSEPKLEQWAAVQAECPIRRPRPAPLETS